MTNDSLNAEQESPSPAPETFGRFSLGQRFLVWLVITLVLPFALATLRPSANTLVALCFAGSVAMWFVLRIGKRMGIGMSLACAMAAATTALYVLSLFFGGIHYIKPD